MVSGDLGAHQNKKYNCEGHDIISKSPFGILIKFNLRIGELGTRQCSKKPGSSNYACGFLIQLLQLPHGNRGLSWRPNQQHNCGPMLVFNIKRLNGADFVLLYVSVQRGAKTNSTGFSVISISTREPYFRLSEAFRANNHAEKLTAQRVSSEKCDV